MIPFRAGHVLWQRSLILPHCSSRVASLSTTTTTTATDRPPLVLYQYAICPFCNIVKSILHYTKQSYESIEVNPLTKRELKGLGTDYRKVPILQVVDKDNPTILMGSDKIVDALLQTTDTRMDTTSPLAMKWTQFARDDLAPLLYPNLCNTWGNSYRAFAYVHSVPTFTRWDCLSIQWMGSVAMYLAASKVKKRRNITNEQVALMEALQGFEDALELASSSSSSSSSEGQQDTKDNSLLLDSSCRRTARPNLGDLTMYGVLRGLDGLQVHTTVLKEYPHMERWYRSMAKLVDGRTSP